MERFFVLGVFLSLFATTTFAAQVNVLGPNKISSGTLSKKTYSYNFAAAQRTNSVLTITNGDGSDLSPKTCSGNLVKKLLCAVENLLILAKAELQRPQSIEFILNGRTILNSSNLPQSKGSLQIPVTLLASNSMTVKLGNLPTQYLTFTIKADGATSNQLPLANFTMTPNSGIAPEAISMNAMLSSDPDGSIVDYFWEFGDGQTGTGSLITHSFVNAGTYNVKLTVTDNQGGKGTKTLPIVIAANQLPIASFSSSVSTDLGELKLSVDGRLSSDPDGQVVSYLFDFGDGQASALSNGDHLYAQGGTYNVKLTVTDNKGGQNSITKSIIVTDVRVPGLSLTSPVNGSTLQSTSFILSGTADEPLSSLTAQLDGESLINVTLGSDRKSFSQNMVAGRNGSRTLSIVAKDLAGNTTNASVAFSIDTNLPPIAKLKVTSPSSGIAPLMVLFDAKESSSPQGGTLNFRFDFGDGISEQNTTGLISHQFQNAGRSTVTLTVTDSNGLSSQSQIEVQTTNPVLPPNPANTAPLLSDSKLERFDDQVGFLYKGPNAIQTGIQPNAIEENRVAVIRGKIIDEDNQPLSGVKITVLEMPEIGQTLSRTDGVFDIAVNGGATLTVTYERNGYFPVQRKVSTSPQNYFWSESIMMIKPDAKVTQVSLNSPTIQIVKGSKVTDSSGSRTAVVVLPKQVQAQLQMPDGSMRPMSTLSVRATEYTVGDRGPERMPGPLPSTTSYTYAVDLSADEAIAAGADHVVFSSPVPFYVDNFLNFRAGVPVPFGTYDKRKGAWIGEKDGIVAKVLSIENGKAVLDLNGNDSPATQQRLSILKITDDELTKIAELYTPGQSFWRVLTKHFSPQDCNFLMSPVSNMQGASNSSSPRGGGSNDNQSKVNSCGSIIGVNEQSLGERLQIPGLPFSLNYTSMTKPGRKSENEIVIPIFPDEYSARVNSFDRIHFKIEIAGQVHEEEVPNGTLSRTWVWNGLDGYGRPVHRSVEAKIQIFYEDGSLYRINPEFFEDNRTFSFPSPNSVVSNVPSRNLFVNTRTFNIPVGQDQLNGPTDVGGWTLSNVHRYNPFSKKLYLGSGSSVDARDLTPIVSTIAGSGSTATGGFSGDGNIATRAMFRQPSSVALAPDGSIYVGDSNNYRIRKIDPNGVIQTVVGTGTAASGPDGLSGTSTSIRSVGGMTVGPDNSLYFVDTAASVVRKLGANGVVTTIAGTTSRGFSGDGGPANLARLADPTDLALLSDGSILIVDSTNSRIRKVTPDGFINTIAGNGNYATSGDGGHALLASIGVPQAIAVSPDQKIYVASIQEGRVRVILGDGTIHAFAGADLDPTVQYADGPALTSYLNHPRSLAVDNEGTVYIADTGATLIRAVTPDGMMRTIAGNRNGGVASDSASAALSARINPNYINIFPDKRIVIADSLINRVRIYQRPLPNFSEAGYGIASTDGSEIYQFDSLGLHKRTLFSRTGQPKWTFEYDNNGQLISMKDQDNLTTQISRDSSGRPVSFTGPFNQNVALSINSGGYLASVTNASSERTEMTYHSGGLLAQFKLPKGNASFFEYNAKGELTKDTDANGGFKSLVKIETDKDYTVTQTTAENRKTTMKVSFLSVGTIFETTFPDQSVLREAADQNSKSHSTFHRNRGRDNFPNVHPRLGGMAEYDASEVIYSPVGGNLVGETTKKYTPLSPTDFFQFIETSESTMGEKSISSVYDSRTRTETITTSLGRTQSRTFDAKERPAQGKVGNYLPISYGYNSIGQLSQTQQGDRITRYTYNGRGQLASVENAEGQTSTFEWDTSNRMIASTRPDSKTTRTTYDLNGNVASIQPPDSLIHEFVSNLVDLVAVYTPPSTANSGSTGYLYNLDRDLTRETRPGDQILNYTNDPQSGQLTKVQGPLKSYSFSYGQSTIPRMYESSDGIFLNVERASDHPIFRRYYGPIEGLMNIGYDSQTRFASTKMGSFEILRFYDNDNLLIQSGDLALTREPASGAVLTTQLGSIGQNLAYNSFGEIEQDVTKMGSSTLFSMTFTRDKLGRIVSKSENILGQTKLHSYIYDLAGRLTEVRVDGAVTNTYQYDSNGNRLSKNGVIATYDSQDRLLTSGPATYAYDATGTLLSKQIGTDVSRYTYDEFGQLTKVELPSGKVVKYLTGGENHRLVKIMDDVVKEKYFYQSASQLGAILNADNSIRSLFVYANQAHSPDYMIQGLNKYRFVKDQLGSIRLVVDSASGVIAQRIDYDEFGKVISDSNPGFQPFGFAGGIYDFDTGLVRFGARDYDSEVGRWTAKDPIRFEGGDTNLYCYAGNDPMNRIDPDGKSWQAIALLLGGFGAAYLVKEIYHFIKENPDAYDSIINFIRGNSGANGEDTTSNNNTSPERFPASEGSSPSDSPPFPWSPNGGQGNNSASEKGPVCGG